MLFTCALHGLPAGIQVSLHFTSLCEICSKQFETMGKFKISPGKKIATEVAVQIFVHCFGMNNLYHFSIYINKFRAFRRRRCQNFCFRRVQLQTTSCKFRNQSFQHVNQIIWRSGKQHSIISISNVGQPATMPKLHPMMKQIGFPFSHGMFQSCWSGQVSLHAQMAALCQGASNFIQKETLPARNEGHELWFETMPGFRRCFLPITEFFPAEESTHPLIPSKKRSATSPVVGWRPVQTASQPFLRRQRFDVCSKFPILNCAHRWPWQKCKLMYTVSMRVCHACRITC